MTYTLDNIRMAGLLGIRFADYSLIVFIAGAVIMAAIGYLIGSLNFAIIISKIKYHDDIRKYGSGNAGMTNMVRTYGTAAGIFTFLGDLFKGIVVVLITKFLFGEACAYIAGLACILGHCFPCWYNFKGGKGVAVSAALILTLEPVVFAVVIIVFILVVLVTRYISLGSVMAALIYPWALSKFYPRIHQEAYLYFIITICSILIALLIVFLHRENLKRLLDGKENKFAFKKKGTRNSENSENINKD